MVTAAASDQPAKRGARSARPATVASASSAARAVAALAGHGVRRRPARAPSTTGPTGSRCHRGRGAGRPASRRRRRCRRSRRRRHRKWVSAVSSSARAWSSQTTSPVTWARERKPDATQPWSSSTPACRPTTPSRETRSSRPSTTCSSASRSPRVDRGRDVLLTTQQPTGVAEAADGQPVPGGHHLVVTLRADPGLAGREQPLPDVLQPRRTRPSGSAEQLQGRRSVLERAAPR